MGGTRQFSVHSPWSAPSGSTLRPLAARGPQRATLLFAQRARGESLQEPWDSVYVLWKWKLLGPGSAFHTHQTTTPPHTASPSYSGHHTAGPAWRVGGW